MKRALRDRLLWVAATDSTFERAVLGDGFVLLGRCIHCRRKLQLTLEGLPLGPATLEHIVPRNHGGDDRRDNLALACSRCNAGKGRRLDCRRKSDPDLVRVIELLQRRRRERLRQPPADWVLPPSPPGWDA